MFFYDVFRSELIFFIFLNIDNENKNIRKIFWKKSELHCYKKIKRIGNFTHLEVNCFIFILLKMIETPF